MPSYPAGLPSSVPLMVVAYWAMAKVWVLELASSWLVSY